MGIAVPGRTEPARPRPRLVLASASERRRDLLALVHLSFEIRPPACDEALRPAEGPAEYAARMARQKALAVAAEVGATSPTFVLGADTVVVVAADGSPAGVPPEILGKPDGKAEARRMLSRLSGREHEVVTAFCLVECEEGRAAVRAEQAVTTAVRFKPLRAAEIDGYLDSGEWQGKAGAYAVQGLAAFMVESIRGSYTAVVGLPLCEVIEALWRARALVAFPASPPGAAR